MSSIATFYLLPETGRAEFTDAHRNQKSITYKRSLFGRKEVITGERFLWEYLDSAATDRTELPFSGFPLIDYLFTFVATNLPENLQAALSAAAIDEHYYAISADLAAKFAEYLQSYTRVPPLCPPLLPSTTRVEARNIFASSPRLTTSFCFGFAASYRETSVCSTSLSDGFFRMG